MTQTDKLSLFVEDMRRGEIECLPPVHQRQPGGILGRGRQGSLRLGSAQGRRREGDGSAGRGARGEGPVQVAGRFRRAHRSRVCSTGARSKASPRQAHSMRSPPTARPSMPRPRPSWRTHRSAAEQRTSGQHGLFGGSAASRRADPPDARRSNGRWPSAWPPSAIRSASISRRIRSTSHRHLLEAQQGQDVRPARRRCRCRRRAGQAATMAGLVEEARWRTSAKGRRYLMATLSDSSGQFQASIFDDEASAAVEAAAKAQTCGLLTVELDKRPGDELPRVAIKRFQPLETLAKRTRLQMEIRVSTPSLVPAIARELSNARGGGGIVRLVLPLSTGGEAVVIGGPRLHARRGARGPHRAHHRRGERRPLRAGAAEARPRRLRLRPSRSRRRLRGR